MRSSLCAGVDIQDVTGNAVNYPMIGDVDLEVAKAAPWLASRAAALETR